MLVEEVGVEGGANDTGQNAQGHFLETNNSRQGIHQEEEDATKQECLGNQLSVIRSNHEAAQVGDNQTNPTDVARNRN